MKLFRRTTVTLVFLLASCGDDRSSSTCRSIEDIEQLRRDADSRVFPNEREAQRHETAFVRLWDAMRTGEPFVALKAFPFEGITIPRPGESETLSFSSLPIERMVFSGSVDLLTTEVARQSLASANSAGWSIVQSEWHHDTFFPAEGGNLARSLVSFEVHAE
ncbi:MAG: hypothetical protein VCA36_05100, partial [Opitutales bacterium]